ncbi:hypothetical protein F0344_11505 [Streptomyces finlayi]|uniref:Uncharacterized protein n=1 Tax=Streptomyces finlayi TaxID=67296 RepID=A0A7G7BII5_9ACTN|nr:hypothetical protein [Streptomyces finlayi]QNE75150.1 hypothetical protein F0344_11505 [Streptomyces finlayi]
MSLHEELTAFQHCLDDLVRTVGRLERSLARLREDAAGRTGSPEHPAGMVTITEAPYDATLWTDSDDEGLGVRGRHAP